MKPKVISQEKLAYTYNSAIGRMAAHPEYADKKKEIVNNCKFINADDAIKEALQMLDSGNYDCRVWAKIEIDEEFYFLSDQWLVTDNWDVSLAAEYVGLYLVYDDTELQKMI